MATIITLPDRDEMANRLVAVDGSGDLVRHFYPRLLSKTGKSSGPAGFVVLMNEALGNYATGSPKEGRPGRVVSLITRVGEFTRALIDDEDARTEIFDVFESAGVPVRREV
jgi:hypothetical protein